MIGARRQDGRTVLIGTAFSVMAGLLALHGIATPGILMGDNGVVAFTGGATLPIGGAILALAALPQLRHPGRVRVLLAVQAALLVGVLGLGAAGFAFAQLVPGVPEPGSALISTRVYREAWPHERAIALLHQESGTKLDRRCVAGLERVLARERQPQSIAV